MKRATGRARTRDLPRGGSLPRLEVQLTFQAFDEILRTAVLPFGETLAHLIYHHTRRAVLLQPTEQLLFTDGEIDPSQVPLEATWEQVPHDIHDQSPFSAYAFVIVQRCRLTASSTASLR